MSITIQEFARLVNHKLPSGQKFERAYQAFEGDIRVIATDDFGREYRYTVTTTALGFLMLEPI